MTTVVGLQPCWYGSQFPLQPYLNGSSEAPQVGDLLIYAREYLNTGHVAVVTEVDLKSGVIKVAEQKNVL